MVQVIDISTRPRRRLTLVTDEREHHATVCNYDGKEVKKSIHEIDVLMFSNFDECQ